MQHVMMLLAILILIVFSGCATKECVAIPQKCVIPNTQEPIIDYEPCVDKDYACVVSKVLKNYEAQKNYAKELKANSEICK